MLETSSGYSFYLGSLEEILIVLRETWWDELLILRAASQQLTEIEVPKITKHLGIFPNPVIWYYKNLKPDQILGSIFLKHPGIEIISHALEIEKMKLALQTSANFISATVSAGALPRPKIKFPISVTFAKKRRNF